MDAKLMQAFETFMEKQENTVRVSDKLSDLSGIGTEYLIIDGYIVAKFWDGNLVGVLPGGNSEKTVA